ncbi:hypothetical protein FIU86_18110 [Roseovarius sp. THAF9]|nr:hypothetical protein FIU86_18110 [Roseovarius sp. THAF9]
MDAPCTRCFRGDGTYSIGCVNLSGLLWSFLASGIDGIRLFSCLLKRFHFTL